MANEGMRNTVYVRWNLVNLNSFMISWLHPVPETESNHIRRELCPAIRAECSIPCPCCSGSQSCERKVVMTGLWCCFQKPPLGGILCLVIHHSRVCKCEPLIHSTHSSASCPLDGFFLFHISYPNALTPSGSKMRIWVNQWLINFWASNSPGCPGAMSLATFCPAPCQLLKVSEMSISGSDYGTWVEFLFEREFLYRVVYHYILCWHQIESCVLV